MHRIIPSLFIVLLVHSLSFAQRDEVGSGRSITFDGVDDYVDANNIYDNVTFPITISAWIFKEPSSFLISPIFVSQDNAPLYNGFWFCLSQTNLFFEYGDGLGDQNSAFRRGKSTPVPNIENRWIYVTAVVKSATDIQLFTNGKNAGGAYTGFSDRPMASNYPNDVAKIGYFSTNSVTHRFKGMIDEVRIWNRALTEQEIRESMCKRLAKSEPGLIGHWDFDETSGDIVFDQSTNGYNGTLKGNPQRVYSGAPLGNESSFLYTSLWTAQELSHNNVRVSNVQGNPFGAHIYSVNSIPSQTGGLDVQAAQPPYHGVFLADDSDDNSFDFAFTDSDAACGFFQRKDNSIPNWIASDDFTGVPERMEVIPIFVTADFDVDLGPDASLCDLPSYQLDPNIEPAGKTFLWNTGETSSSINVTASGKYNLEVTDGCTVSRDTVEIAFRQSPPQFSLGDDQELCDFSPRILAVNPETNEFDITWQDGSSEEHFLAEDFGTYWVSIENACGASYDSITFTEVRSDISPQYNFISPGNHDDRNQFFVLDGSLSGLHLSIFNRWGKEVYRSMHYDNRWDGGDLPAGVYFYTIHGRCIESYKGTLTIMR